MIIKEDPFVKLTPMMEQYLDLKRGYQDAILFFRLGDFYEMFFDDAKTAAGILGLALTAREAGKGRKVPMCGIPFHAAENYIARLVKSGHKIAICEQMEDPRLAKGIVKRDITRVITPGTVLSPSLLDRSISNFIIALKFSNTVIGISVVELSTGEFKIAQLESESALFDELARISPSEIVLPESIKQDLALIARIKQHCPVLFTYVNDWDYETTQGTELLKRHFKIATIIGFGIEAMPEATGTAAALIKYLETTQKTALAHITTLSTYNPTDFMLLDASTQRNLELIRNSEGKTAQGTLFQVLDKTKTAMGARLLANWILHPFKNVAEINKRLEAVEELHCNNELRDALQEILKPCFDIARLCGRISLKAANAKDLICLMQSLNIVPLLKDKISACSAAVIKDINCGLDPIDEIRELIKNAIVDEPPFSLREGNIIRAGFNASVDELRTIIASGRDWVLNLQGEEIKRTGINSLKIRFNNIFGYYIEITKANLSLVPQDYLRKQTLANAERFTTAKLQEFESKILGAEERIASLEYEVFMQIIENVIGYVERIKNTAGFIGYLDGLLSLASVARANNYKRPVVSDSDIIEIKQGRHPVLEELLPRGQFIANDLYLDKKENQILIITGPNMAGKSTYIRQVGLLVLMAQMGSFIPAETAHMGVIDRIFSRIGASDILASGMSTFMVEMSQTANILNNATDKSLIILDEIGRGTSTFDGLSIAWAVVEYLHDNPKVQAKTLFATHYHELTEANIMLKRVKNFNAAVKEWQGDVIFLYKVVSGGCDHSFGIHVAKLAGLPHAVINRAREILKNLETQSIAFNGEPSFARKRRKEKNEEKQFDLFGIKTLPLYEEIKNLDINSLTPVEALNKLQKYKKQIEENA